MSQSVVDGFYEVDFSAIDRGAGLLVIEGNKVRGGDAQYVYSGRITFLEGSTFSIDLKVASYAAGARSVFNTGQGVFTLNLSGSFRGSEFDATGVADGIDSRATFLARGRKVKSIDLT